MREARDTHTGALLDALVKALVCAVAVGAAVAALVMAGTVFADRAGAQTSPGGVSMPSQDPGCRLLLDSTDPAHYDSNGNNRAFTLSETSTIRVEYERAGTSTSRQETAVRIGGKDIPTDGTVYESRQVFSVTTRGPVPLTEGIVSTPSYELGDYRAFISNVAPTYFIKARVYACEPPEPTEPPLGETLVDASGSGDFFRQIELREGDRVRVSYSVGGSTQERALIALYPPTPELPAGEETPTRGTEGSYDATVVAECGGTYTVRVASNFRTVVDGDPVATTPTSALQYGIEVSVERATGTPPVVAPVVGDPADGQQGGPVALLGIDAEDEYCSESRHGPADSYAEVLRSLASKTQNGGAGVLVIGGGKEKRFASDTENDTVTRFWRAVAEKAGEPVTFASREEVATVPFTGYRVIAVVSEDHETPDGGLTHEENDALGGRKDDVAAFVNSGGGLIGLASPHENPYPYLAGIGAFGFRSPPQFQDISPTAEGLKVGVDNDLRVCCWHDEYTAFPDFLKVLATRSSTGEAVALGGARVVLGPQPENEPPVAEDDEAQTSQGVPKTFDVLANDRDPDGGPEPLRFARLTRLPDQGTVLCTSSGSCTYSPDPGFTGTDSFEYEVSDGAATDTATVRIGVRPGLLTPPTPPVARDDFEKTQENQTVRFNVLRNDSDPDGRDGDLKGVSYTRPEHGTAVCRVDGSCEYTPDRGFFGRDSYRYVVEDADGARDSAVVTIEVEKAPTPIPPEVASCVREPGAAGIRGKEGAAIINGTYRGEVIKARESATVVRGGDGNDVIYVASEATVVYGGAGNDIIIYSAPAATVVHGDSGRDLLCLYQGAASALAGDGNDVIQGHKGASALDPGAGTDRVYGRGTSAIDVKDGRGGDYGEHVGAGVSACEGDRTDTVKGCTVGNTRR